MALDSIILTRGETFRIRRKFPMDLAGWMIRAELLQTQHCLQPRLVQTIAVRVLDGTQDAEFSASADATKTWPLNEEFGGLLLRISADMAGEAAVADEILIHVFSGVGSWIS